MKKWIFITVISLIVVSIYFVIPNIITLKSSVGIDKSERALYRHMAVFDNWKKWWPGAPGKKENQLLLNNRHYVLRDQTFNSFFIDITHDDATIQTGLILALINKDSTRIEWEAQIPTSYNPFIRLKKYFNAKNVEKDMKRLLAKMQTFYSSTVNTYGIDIKREFVKDSTLIATHDSATVYPTPEKIYTLLNTLRDYATTEHAAITDSPMLNIYSKDNKVFYTRVAYPVDRKLSSKGKIEYKWMLKGGNILTAEVKGGQNNLDKALHIMEEYMNDYTLKSPAIPFYSLISNRLTQKDSTQWLTKIYYPVMYYN